MAQVEIYEFLKTERIKGNHQYWTIKQVYDALMDRGISARIWYVNKDVHALARYEYLDFDTDSHFRMKFRIKLKYCER